MSHGAAVLMGMAVLGRKMERNKKAKCEKAEVSRLDAHDILWCPRGCDISRCLLYPIYACGRITISRAAFDYLPRSRRHLMYTHFSQCVTASFI